MTETKFPVNAGTKIKVGCKEGTTLKGSYWIKCIGGYKFDFGEEKPRCEGSTTGLWNSIISILKKGKKRVNIFCENPIILDTYSNLLDNLRLYRRISLDKRKKI
jgi:hypothetical protein